MGAPTASLYPTSPSASDFENNRSGLVLKRVKLVLTGSGGLTNTLTAHLFGLETLIWCSNLVDATNSKGYPAAVDPVNNIVVLYDGSAAPAPVDVTSAAAYITVVGVQRITPSLT